VKFPVDSNWNAVKLKKEIGFGKVITDADVIWLMKMNQP